VEDPEDGARRPTEPNLVRVLSLRVWHPVLTTAVPPSVLTFLLIGDPHRCSDIPHFTSSPGKYSPDTHPSNVGTHVRPDESNPSISQCALGSPVSKHPGLGRTPGCLLLSECKLTSTVTTSKHAPLPNRVPCGGISDVQQFDRRGDQIYLYVLSLPLVTTLNTSGKHASMYMRV